MLRIAASLVVACAVLVGCGSAAPCPAGNNTVSIGSSAEWAQFTAAGCATVPGELRIAAPDLRTLNAPALASMGSLAIQSSPLLQSVSFPALSAVQGSVAIDAPSLASLEMPQLRNVQGDLAVDTPALTAFSLPSLRAVFGKLSLTNESAASVVASIDLPDLQTVGGAIEVSGYPRLRSLALPALSSCGGFQVSFDEGLGAVDLPLLLSIEGDLQVTEDPALTHLGLPAATSAKGDVTLRDDAALPAFSFPALTTVGGALVIDANDFLSAPSLPALTAVGTALEVQFNRSLKPCVAQAIAGQLTQLPQRVALSQNLGSPDVCP